MNPYENLPDKAFWKKSVSSKSMFDISELWDPKFPLNANSKVSTFGSCFAQHIGNALKSRGYNWLITENPPVSLSLANRRKFNYDVFSARTGNIYTTSLLKQWTEWAFNRKDIPSEIWEEDGRYYDPFRPVIEPIGFKNSEELRLSRKDAIEAFRQCIKKSDFFVFTLGLTESWKNARNGYEYPMCPGTAAGVYQENEHVFENQHFEKIRKNLIAAIELMRQENPKLRFILTVSPVPLTATKTDKNVLVATMESKSVLRAVAGQVSNNRDYIDYFPSYEIINSPVFKGAFFEPNQRNVNPAGVDFVMDHFFKCLSDKYGASLNKKTLSNEFSSSSVFDAVCEEELLDAFR
ncbi:GSCFA domain-containing protein [Vreelandella titanicae]|uniref:GSCFA domain-containing protein n=1 Tax=Vreelandella titanicae TaxID=664683 RepID=UPI001142F27E|nr:GSCFA domain-containing protein [Halomonas titanicae]